MQHLPDGGHTFTRPFFRILIGKSVERATSRRGDHVRDDQEGRPPAAAEQPGPRGAVNRADGTPASKPRGARSSWRTRTRSGRILVGLTVAFASVTLFASPVSAAPHYLHSHIDAYSATLNCGRIGSSNENEWSYHRGDCHGWAGYGGNALPFDQKVHIEWSSDASSTHLLGVSLPMPAGYSRWFKASRATGSSVDWIGGAVKMPNGPFSVLTGRINGVAVRADNPHGGVEQVGGPLFLWVGYWGRVSVGDYAHHGYVFGLRGYIDY